VTKAVVVGAGVIGCSIALRLAMGGMQVVLIDKRHGILQGSSNAAFGSLTPYSDPFFIGAARDFSARSVDLYRNSWLHSVEARSGVEVAFGDSGLLELLETSSEIRKGEKLSDALEEAGYRAHMMSRNEILELEPALKGNYRAGLWLDEPWLDCEEYFRALRLCIEHDDRITVVLNTIIKSVEETSHGLKVKTQDAQQIDADHAVISTGPTSHVVEGAGQPALEWIRGDGILVSTLNNKPILQRHVYKNNAFITPRADGRLLLGATYTEETADPSKLEEINTERIFLGAALGLIQVNAELVPDLLNCDLVRVWRGWRVKAASGYPVLGRNSESGAIVATGFIGLGVTMAPAVAEAVHDLIATGNIDAIPAEFQPASHTPTPPKIPARDRAQ